jgi:glucose/arabinose dehydrogenase
VKRSISAVATVLILLAACSGGAVVAVPPASTPTGAASAGSSTQATGSPSSSVALGNVRVRLRKVATLDGALCLAVRAGDPALYVAEQGGLVMAVRDGRVDPFPVLDLRGQITIGGEQGLLGLVFSPDGALVYVDYTDLEGNTNVVEFAMGSDGRAQTETRREVLYVKQPYANHNGGDLVFGPDGDLYVGLGDGGSGGDPQGNGQNLGVLLGKMLRIEPRMPDGSVPPGDLGYAIPDGNPFVGTAGARPEIWAYGLRNPWRYSFDRTTGDLWIGDVGQNAWEEVDLQLAAAGGGQNYGWNPLEGTHPYQGDRPADAVAPVYEYSHDDGRCVVTGGYVYRGSQIPGLAGAYVFADFCAGDLMALHVADGRAVDVSGLGAHLDAVASFGEDATGELYALSLAGGVYRVVAA